VAELLADIIVPELVIDQSRAWLRVNSVKSPFVDVLLGFEDLETLFVFGLGVLLLDGVAQRGGLRVASL
jgi:hypothetical protein